MTTTYQGSCHCGAVTYEADLDLSKGSMKCNCSICAKSRSWLVPVPSANLRLLSGEDMLTDYQFGGRNIHHLFCKTCGVKPFGHTSPAEDGSRMYVVNIATLDDADPAELTAVPVQYLDGRRDIFDAPPAETRHL